MTITGCGPSPSGSSRSPRTVTPPLGKSTSLDFIGADSNRIVLAGAAGRVKSEELGTCDVGDLGTDAQPARLAEQVARREQVLRGRADRLEHRDVLGQA